MATSASTAVVFGNTGLVGSNILSTLLAIPEFQAVHTIGRRAPKVATETPRLRSQVEPDTTKWASRLSSLEPFPSVIFSSLGTTRQQAGGLTNQWKIDHDLNVEMVKAAAASHKTNTFVFISSMGTGSLGAGIFPYTKMKRGVEAAVEKAGFEHAIILRPSLIVGRREVAKQGEGLMRGFVNTMGAVFGKAMYDKLAQDADVIARAAVRAAKLASENKAPKGSKKLWILGPGDIIKLGREEWEE